jgi:glycosyltransferase involved in cell wall biosynthesis
MPERIPVSVVVMTKNEEANLAACLESAARCAEVFVVDSGSIDATRAIAAAHGARVVPFEWNGRYPKKKQWCLENLPFAHDWVLYLDADERLTPGLVDELATLLAGSPEHAGYFAALDYVFLGRTLRHGHRVHKLVLFDRRRGSFHDYPDLDAANMWEVEGHYQPRLTGSVGALRGRILHKDHDSLYHWFERHNRYSDWEAVLNAKGALEHPEETQTAVRRTLKRVFARLPLKGAPAFVDSYILRRGFLDGRAGFHYALARAFYYWQIGIKLRELRAHAAERRSERREAA